MSRDDKNQQEDPNYHEDIGHVVDRWVKNLAWTLFLGALTYPFLAGVWQSLTSEPTTEEVEKRAMREEKTIQELINSLGKNQTSVKTIDLKEFSEKTARETEIQNDMTENELKGTYVKLTGDVHDVDSTPDKFGLHGYQIQLWETKARTYRALPLIVTA